MRYAYVFLSTDDWVEIVNGLRIAQRCYEADAQRVGHASRAALETKALELRDYAQTIEERVFATGFPYDPLLVTHEDERSPAPARDGSSGLAQ